MFSQRVLAVLDARRVVRHHAEQRGQNIGANGVVHHVGVHLKALRMLTGRERIHAATCDTQARRANGGNQQCPRRATRRKSNQGPTRYVGRGDR